MDYVVRVHDELWENDETSEVVTATQAISEFYAVNTWELNWTNYYTFTGQYSDTMIDMPNFKNTVKL